MKSYIFTTFIFLSCNKIENTKLGMKKSENVSEYSNISNNTSTVKYSEQNFIKKNFEEILKKILEEILNDISNKDKDKKESSRNNSFKEETESISSKKNVNDKLFEIFLKSLDKFENLKELFELEIKSKFFCKCNTTENEKEYLIEKNFGIQTSLEDYCRYLNVEESIKTKKFKCDKCNIKIYNQVLEIKTSKYIAFFIENFEKKYFKLVHYRCIKIYDDTFYIKNMIGYDYKNHNFKEEDLFDRNYSTPVLLLYEKKEKEKEKNNEKFCLNYFKGENPYCTGKNQLAIGNSSAKINTKNFFLKDILKIFYSKEAQEYLSTKQNTACTFPLAQNKIIENRTKIFPEKSPIKSTINQAVSSITNSISKFFTPKKESISEENPTLENIKLEDINFNSNEKLKQKNKISLCCYATEIRLDESVRREEIENIFSRKNLEKSILWNFIYLNHENLNQKVYGDRIATLYEIIFIFEYIFENPEKKLSLLEKLIVSRDSINEIGQKYFYCTKFSIEENLPILYFGKVKENEIAKDYIYLMVRDMKEKKERNIFCCLFSVFCCCNCCKRVYIEN